MIHKQPNTIIFLITFSAMYLSTTGYPMINTAENIVNDNEKIYPNGTIIGRYTYNDKEGNPIHVKYYADNASYGVELRSIKILNSDLSPLQTGEKYSLQELQATEHPFESGPDLFTGFKDLKSFKTNLGHPSQINKDKAKGDLKNNEEFEVLLQNEIKAPEKCGKEKVKVYFDKDKRKTRNSPKSHDSMGYCKKL